MKNLAIFAGEQADKAQLKHDMAVDLTNRGLRDEANTAVVLAELHLALGELAIALAKDLMGKGDGDARALPPDSG